MTIFFLYIAFSRKRSIKVELFNMTSPTDGENQIIQKRLVYQKMQSKKISQQNDLSPIFSGG